MCDQCHGLTNKTKEKLGLYNVLIKYIMQIGKSAGNTHELTSSIIVLVCHKKRSLMSQHRPIRLLKLANQFCS